MPADVADLTQLRGFESLARHLRVAFEEAALPASFLRIGDTPTFNLGPDVAQVEVPGLGWVLRFGTGIAGFRGDFCLEPDTGAVQMAMPGIPAVFVNSTLVQFGRTMRLFQTWEQNFTTGDADACFDAGQQLRAGLDHIDEPAAHPETYWGSIMSDIEGGNYSTNPDF